MKIPLTGNPQIDEATIRAAVKAAEAHAEARQTVADLVGRALQAIVAVLRRIRWRWRRMVGAGRSATARRRVRVPPTPVS